MTGLEHALIGLRQALDAPQRHHVWRRLVRLRMTGVRDALVGGWAHHGDEWLAARELSVQHERSALLTRMALLVSRVLEEPDVESVRADLQRLVTDLEHHRQHLNDLVYDSVSLELGGSD